MMLPSFLIANHWRIPAILAGAFALLTLVLGAIGISEGLQGAQLAREGVQTIGRVTGGHSSTAHRRRGGTTVTYYLELAFADAQGRQHSANYGVSRAVYDRAHAGQSVPLIYAASDPSVVEYVRGSTSRNAVILGFLAAGSAMAVWFCAWIALATRRAMQRAGAAVAEVARVTRHKPTSRLATAKLAMEWQAKDGSTRRTKPVHRDKAMGVGGPLQVHRDPVTGREWWAQDLGLGSAPRT